MEAIVLAGGLGTRLRSVVSDLPKPMAPIEDTPFLEYILKYLQRNSITRVVLSVGYKWETIKDYFGDNFEGIELIYSIEDEPLGTGGAIKKAIENINSEEVFIINGDTFFDVDLSLLRKEFHTNHSQLLLSLKEMHNFDRYGCVEIDASHNIVAFSEKTARVVGNINGGIYLMKSKVFNRYKLPYIFSFEEFMQDEFKNLNATGLVFKNYFIDIGIPEDYAKAQNELKHHI